MIDMLFHEVYGVYFAIVKTILSQKHPLTTKELDEIIRAKGFDESSLQVLPSLQNKRSSWFLLREENGNWLPVTQHSPEFIQTTLERRWLKTVLTDPRLMFFMEPNEIADLNLQLEGVAPLFTLSSLTYFDQFQQTDSLVAFTQQQSHFKQLLAAIQEKKQVRILYQRNPATEKTSGKFLPVKLEYSQKNNLFRLKAWRILRRSRFEVTLNLNRILSIHSIESVKNSADLPITSRQKQASVTCILVDKRQALKRSMDHFADFQKTTRRLDETHYELTIHYATADETEVLIRLLSFGPFLTVTAPERFVQQVKERVEAQKKWLDEK